MAEAPAGQRPLPALADLLADLHVVAIPLRVRFRGIGVREVALIDGPRGWGEFGPFLEYDAAESSRWLASALEAAWWGWPAPVRDSVPVNATVPAVAPDEVSDVLQRFPGCTTAKVKVAQTGQLVSDDVARVREVRALMGERARIRIDANGGWGVPDALDALARLAPLGLEYAEQPTASVEELRELRIALARKGIDVAIAADESIRKAEDPLRVRDLEAADLIVVKVAPLGGVTAALSIVRECGLPAVVSSALDTSVGMAAGVALAAALPDLDHACGLGTVSLFEGDVCSPSVVPREGFLSVDRPAIDPESVQRWRAEPAREQWWRERVAAAYAVLSGA